MRTPLIFILLALLSCRRSYTPEVRTSEQSLLVVEGNINPGEDSTFVLLSRSLNLSDTQRVKFENNATVTVEGRDNTIRTLVAMGKGTYASAPLYLNIGSDYRLRIKTSNGEEYLSDYVQAKRSPEIDSVSWELDTTGVHVYVNTHDHTASTRYYRWDLTETWQIRMPIFAELIYERGMIRPAVFPQDNMWECWMYDSTHSLILANSEKLDDDIIYKKNVITIPYHDQRILFRWSIEAKQYAIDRQASEFFGHMKQNTEDVGNIFSPLPFEFHGNVRSVKDTSHYALGYVTASTITRKRIFINGVDLVYWRAPRLECLEDGAFVRPTIADFRYYFDQQGFMPIREVWSMGVFLGYSAGKPVCIDCRVLGANSKRPDFW